MPGRVEITDSNTVDIGKRYDIYVAQTMSSSRDTGVVVYRNAFFRGGKALEKSGRFELWNDDVEIEQPDGTSVFIRKYAIICFCDAGTKLTCEPFTPAG
jgi:hypothetical protein